MMRLSGLKPLAVQRAGHMDIGEKCGDKWAEALKHLKRLRRILRFDNVKSGILKRNRNKLADQCVIVDNDDDGRGRRCLERRQAVARSQGFQNAFRDNSSRTLAVPNL
jgi:hypothetical protein